MNLDSGWTPPPSADYSYTHIKGTPHGRIPCRIPFAARQGNPYSSQI